MIHPKIAGLFIENEYGIEYMDYWREPDPELIRFAEDNYNINTDCHNACINCQLNQVDKYEKSNGWNVKVAKTHLYRDNKLSEPIGVLRKFQKVQLIERRHDLANVSTVTHYGVCIKDASHPTIYREKKSYITELRCEVCESGLSARSHKVEGWLPFKHLTGFTVKCDFIPRDYADLVPANLKATLTDAQMDALLTVIDPTRWARDFLGVELREHQKLDAMCTAKHTVRRWGRRSGKTFSECIKLLLFALTKQIDDGVDSNGNPRKRGPRILVISPYLAQISLIFEELRKLVSRNPDIHIARDVKTPYHEMKFADTPTARGAVISGFTTGAQSGNEGGTVRGQSADLILLDEVDAMPEDDIVKAVQPIQATTPNVLVMSSSTPMGKQEWFWKQCLSSPHVKETYFPSTILDHWDDVKDEIEQEGLTDSRFLQEYMAKFITQVDGVYQPLYIAEAEVPYEYKQSNPIFWEGQDLYLNAPQPGWTYSIGVDWNTNAGVEIVVTGLPAERVEFWVVDAVNIPKHEYQQHQAMDVIVKLNRFWGPKFIYVDRGYGNTQIESLQIYSDTQRVQNPGSPDAKLKDILKPFDFSRKLKYRNPSTSQLEEVLAKPFMIENSVRQFEQGRVRYSHKDFMLHNQLHNYIEQGKTPSGMPRYGMNDDKIGDHRLDALNLALVAYILEMSNYAVNSGAVVKIMHSAGFGSDRIKRSVSSGDRNWVEFVQGLPEGLGVPGRMKVRYDPGYVEMKESEGAHRGVSSRISDIDNAGRYRDKTDTLRIGFESDTEWKQSSARKPSSRVANIRSSKPSRRTF